MILGADEEVVRLDVPMYHAFLVALLYSLYHHDCDHATCFEVELVAARLKQVLQALSEQLHDHHVELIVWYRLIRANVIQLWYLSYIKKNR